MSDYIKKLSQMKSDIGIIQDSIFFELHNLEQELTTIKEQNKKLRECVKVNANQLEGVSLAFRVHGLNLNKDFFIDNCLSNAEAARKCLEEIKQEKV